MSADNHPVAGIQGAREDHAGQLVVHPPLYRTPQGPRPELGVEALFGYQPDRPFGEFDLYAPWALRRLVGDSWGAAPSFSSMASQRSEGGRGGSPAPSSPSRRTCRSGLWSQGPNALRASARRHEKGAPPFARIAAPLMGFYEVPRSPKRPHSSRRARTRRRPAYARPRAAPALRAHARSRALRLAGRASPPPLRPVRSA